jgi:hypothetical protein
MVAIRFSKNKFYDVMAPFFVHDVVALNTDMVVNCQAVKVFPVHLFSCGYAVPYISGHMPDQNLG